MMTSKVDLDVIFKYKKKLQNNVIKDVQRYS